MQPTQDKPHIVNAALLALLIIALYIPAITITAELVPPLKNWLASTYGHHWVGKGIIMMIVYAVVFILGIFAYRVRRSDTISQRFVEWGSTFSVLSSILIIAFFIYEYVIHLHT